LSKAIEKQHSTSFTKAVIQLFKLRLSFLVVVSAVLSYWFAKTPESLEIIEILLLSFGGMLVTGSSNTLNQIFERELDKLMKRTENRPLPQGNISVSSAWFVAILSGVVGLFLLYQLNLLSFILGASALVSYAFIYTPLKRVTPFAVFVGAIPGAIPPMLGWVAATGHFGLPAGLLFCTQFMWQFPHFWAIAWVLHEDYRLGGFSLLPSAGGKNKSNAFQILMYSIYLIPISILPWLFGLTGVLSAIVCTVAGLGMLFYAIQLYKKCDDATARKLMFASFFYLPIVQIIYVVDKIVL
jgi:protoheme IX farnesyltransferase